MMEQPSPQPKVTTREIIDDDTPISSIKWGFVVLVRLGVVLSVVTAIAIIVLPFINIPNGARAVDIGSLLGLNGIVFGSAFGGHVASGFTPPDRTAQKPPSNQE